MAQGVLVEQPEVAVSAAILVVVKTPTVILYRAGWLAESPVATLLVVVEGLQAASREQGAAVDSPKGQVVDPDGAAHHGNQNHHHPLDHHSHHPEECYTHPEGQLEVFQQGYIPDDAYLDISGINVRQTTLVQR